MPMETGKRSVLSAFMLQEERALLHAKLLQIGIVMGFLGGGGGGGGARGGRRGSGAAFAVGRHGHRALFFVVNLLMST